MCSKPVCKTEDNRFCGFYLYIVSNNYGLNKTQSRPKQFFSWHGLEQFLDLVDAGEDDVLEGCGRDVVHDWLPVGVDHRVDRVRIQGLRSSEEGTAVNSFSTSLTHRLVISLMAGGATSDIITRQFSFTNLLVKSESCLLPLNRLVNLN